MWSDVVVLWRNGKLCYFGVKRKSDYCKDNSLEWLKLGKCFANHGLEIITHKVSNHNTFLVWVQFTSRLALIHVQNTLQQAQLFATKFTTLWAFSNSWLQSSATLFGPFGVQQKDLRILTYFIRNIGHTHGSIFKWFRWAFSLSDQDAKANISKTSQL